MGRGGEFAVSTKSSIKQKKNLAVIELREAEKKQVLEFSPSLRGKDTKKGEFFFSKDLLLVFTETIFLINVNEKESELLICER